tara:strand:+ start:574 stop:978 length:405 start_codon:yes stop_codon:yes gene_type:complete
MAKIIKFPTGEEIIQDKKERDRQKLRELSDELVATSQYLLDIMEEFLVNGQASELKELMQMNIRDEAYQESRDMYVVVNILNSMLNRYFNLPHALHRDMDRLYIKLKKMQKAHDDGQEIIFDFDPELGDPDDTD